MELFDTYFVWFGQVLAVSGKKTLVISHHVYTHGKITTYQGSFQNTYSKMKQTSDYECKQLNGTV